MTVYVYPRPPRGGRLVTSVSSCSSSGFLSTPSARRATGTFHGASRNTPYFYPRPPRGGRPAQSLRRRRPSRISIHALREEGDLFLRLCVFLAGGNFYPRPPRGGRPSAYSSYVNSYAFLSTPSARRATAVSGWATRLLLNFYPRPPRGGRHGKVGATTISSLFLSTPSARRATAKTETKSLFSNKLYNILHEFRRALIYNGSKNYPNHAK